MKRLLISSGAPWEKTVGYSRAVRVGNVIEVAGTTAVDGDEFIGIGDAYVQMRFILARIERAINEAGGRMAHVVRTRMYVTSSHVIDDVLRAHGEAFAHIRPAATLLVVDALIDPRLLVEVEATVIIDD